MNKIFTFFILGGLFFTACQPTNTETTEPNASEEAVVKTEKSELLKQAQMMFGNLPEVADNELNPLSDEKVILGQMLYFDKRLSKGETQSCNTCHNLNTYGVDNLPTSPGDNGTLGTRNSPTTLNAAFHATQFWDGREPDVEAQAGGPVLNPIEMGMPSEEFTVERLVGIAEYQDLFVKAFPGEEAPITYANMKKAIGAFERKLVTPSKFDHFLAGDETALNEQEKKGLETYIKVGCTTCHMGNVLGGNMLQKFGIFAEYWTLTGSKVIDEGLFTVTQKETDKYIFKVPALRNVAKTAPYFHDGSVADLAESVKIMAKTELNKDITEEEVKDIVAFLNTLTGEVPADLAKDPFAVN
jgi:cytochrome c peroxidase